MTDLYIAFINVMATGGIFLIVMFWFLLYFYINFVMINKDTKSGDDMVNDIIRKKYDK